MNLLDKVWSSKPIIRFRDIIAKKEPIINKSISDNIDIQINDIDSLENLEKYINETNNHFTNDQKCVLTSGNGKFCVIHEYYKKNNTDQDKQFIDKILAKYEYVENIIHIYFIPFNINSKDNITEKEYKLFAKILYKIIKIIQPTKILTLGSIVSKYLFPNDVINISSMRGSRRSFMLGDYNIPTIMTLHPISVLRNKEYLALFADDIYQYTLL